MKQVEFEKAKHYEESKQLNLDSIEHLQDLIEKISERIKPETIIDEFTLVCFDEITDFVNSIHLRVNSFYNNKLDEL